MAQPTLPFCTIVTPVGMLGYGWNQVYVEEELAQLKHDHPLTALILDSGSTDSGAGKLATGAYMTCARSNYVRDLTKLIKLVVKYHVPLIVSSAGGDGSNAHVDELVKIVQEVFAAVDSSRPLNVISIYAEIDKDLVYQRLDSGRITGCGKAVPTLTRKDLDSTPRVVGQMGSEPFLDAMLEHPEFDVIIGGRAYDVSPYVAWSSYCYLKSKGHADRSVLNEQLLGIFQHCGQIMECGGSCATPKSASAVAKIYETHFNVYSPQPGAKCSPLSVAAHTLYEKSRPDLLYGPGGFVDLTNAKYEQEIDGRSVNVHGAVFQKTAYTVKLEGGTILGYRSLFIGSFCDPVLCAQLDDFLHRISVYVEQQHHDVKEPWKLHFHRYGEAPNPVCIIGEALADTQSLSKSLITTARIACTHGPYPGQVATSGNLGFGIGSTSPELDTGACAIFSVYHLMELDDSEERGAPLDSQNSQSLFRWKINTFAVSAGHEHSDLLAVVKAIEPPKTPIPQYDAPAMNFSTLRGIAQVVRSKNAGPFSITCDVIFQELWCYRLIKESNLLNKDTICRLFGADEDDIEYLGYFDQAKAFKVTFARRRDGKPTPSGGYAENDVHGSQRYLPLLNLEIPATLRSQLEAASQVPIVNDRVNEDEEVSEVSDAVEELQVRDASEIDIPALRIIRSSVSA